MPDVYYVTNWPYHEHRDMAKAKRLRWVKAKVDYQGDDWLRLTSEAKDPFLVLGVWEMARGLALLSPFRGLLLSDGHKTLPHRAETIARKCHLPQRKIQMGLNFLVREIGWLGIATVESAICYPLLCERLWGAEFCAKNALESQNKREKSAPTEHNITEHNITGLRDAWNKCAKNLKLPRVEKLTDARRAKVRARLAATDWPWREALKRIAKSPFLLGENDRNWKVNFDWFISNEDNAYKIIEGKYGQQESKDGGPRPL